MKVFEGGHAPELVLFTATTGRTGTMSLVELFNRNVPGGVAEHEASYRPQGGYERLYRALCLRDMGSLEKRCFGRALDWYDRDDPALIRLVRMRARRIRRQACRVYLESSHAFLSSMGEAMADEFPDLGLIHLVRDPLEVAVSYCNRNTHPVETSAFLRALGNWHPHPDSRKNCLPPPDGRLTCLQYYLWVWIEAELRFLRFIERHPAIRHFQLETRELNDPGRIAALFGHFGIHTETGRIDMPPARNRNRKETQIDGRHLAEAGQLLRRIDPEILRKLPCPYRLIELATG